MTDRPRLAARLTPDALRQVRGGHPWVFARSIVSVSPGGAPGDLVVVFDDRRRFAAIGLYDPASPIRVRILHRGRPATIDPAWWAARVAAAAQRRAALPTRGTTGYRVVHGENDGLPGLVVDRYETTYVVKLYAGALVPHVPTIVDAVAALGADRVVLRVSRLVRAGQPPGVADGTVLAGPVVTGPVPFRENGLDFEADVVAGQKTGHFLDQRDNRALVGAHARGARVLDVFACTGGFGLHAAAGGARSVHSVDLSAAAIAAAERTRARNASRARVAACRFTADVGDAFAVLPRLAGRGAQYDLVVVDPPSFAANRASVPGALRAYGGLTALALALVAPGGLLFQASCSSRVSAEQFVTTVQRAAASVGVSLDELARPGQPLDHPVGFPEGAYLKAVLARRRA